MIYLIIPCLVIIFCFVTLAITDKRANDRKIEKNKIDYIKKAMNVLERLPCGGIPSEQTLEQLESDPNGYLMHEGGGDSMWLDGNLAYKYLERAIQPAREEECNGQLQH